MDKNYKIGFIASILTAELSGCSLNNQKIAENVRTKVERELNILINDKKSLIEQLERCNSNYIDTLIKKLGYSQIL